MMMQPGQPMMIQGQPGQAMMMMQSGQPMMMQPGQPMMMQPGQPMMMQGQGQGQPMMQPGQPMMMQPGQPMIMQGQPMMVMSIYKFVILIYLMNIVFFCSSVQNMQQGVQMMPMQPLQQPIFAYCAPENPWLPLQTCSEIFVEQQIGIIEAITHGAYEEANKYKIFANTAGLAYFAVEESSCMSRCFCAPNHELTVHFYSVNRNGPELFKMLKPFKCCCPACAPCCQKEATVTAVNGSPIAYFQQPCFGGCCTPVLDAYESQGGKKIGTLSGPFCCIGGLCCSTNFQVC